MWSTTWRRWARHKALRMWTSIAQRSTADGSQVSTRSRPSCPRRLMTRRRTRENGIAQSKSDGRAGAFSVLLVNSGASDEEGFGRAKESLEVRGGCAFGVDVWGGKDLRARARVLGICERVRRRAYDGTRICAPIRSGYAGMWESGHRLSEC